MNPKVIAASIDWGLLKEISATTWGVSAAFGALTFLGLWFFTRFLSDRISRWTTRTSSKIDDLIIKILRSTRAWFLFIWGFYVFARSLPLNETYDAFLNGLVILASIFQVALWGNHVIDFSLNRALESRGGPQDGDAILLTVFPTLRLFGRFLLYSLLLLVALDNLGFNVKALLAGLGIGGIAVALAAQNVLGDIFASLSILFDRPFVVGDFIKVGDHVGAVEKIGLKTTRIRSLSGEQLVVSNNDLLSSRIQNFQRLLERRVVFQIGVTYDTPSAKLKEIPNWIKSVIANTPHTRFSRCHFSSYGDFSLNFETVYFFLGSDFNNHMDVLQSINLGIFEKLKKEGVKFALPTRTIISKRDV